MKKHLAFILVFGLLVCEPLAAKEKKEKKPVPEFSFKRFYADVSVGYGYPIAGDVWEDAFLGCLIGAFTPAIFLDPYPRISCLSEGLTMGAGIGYRFNKHLALEMNGHYMAWLNTTSGAYGFIKEYRRLDSLSNGRVDEKLIARVDDYHYIIGAQSGSVAVQMVVSPGFARVDPYVKAGMVFSLANMQLRQRYTVREPDSYTGIEWNWINPVFVQRYEGNQWTFRAGFVGALGMNIHLTPLISVFADWQFAVSNLVWVDWRALPLVSETGSRSASDIEEAIGEKLPAKQDHNLTTFSNFGIHFGVKFKF